MSVQRLACKLALFSCLYQFAVLEFLLDGSCGLNTLTSRNVFSWRPPPEPFHRDVKSGTVRYIEVLCETRLYLSEVGDRVPPRHHGILRLVGRQ